MKRKLLLFLLSLMLMTTASPWAAEVIRHAVRHGQLFENRYASNPSRGNFLKWQIQRLWYGLPHEPNHPLEPIPPDLGYLRHPGGQTSVTWIGHASVLLQLDGLNILTDPMFSEYASPIPPLGPKRHQPPGLSLQELPHVDVVLISHNHYDHMDLGSLRVLALQAGGPPQFLIPLGNERWFRDNIPGLTYDGPGRNVFAMDWDDQHTVHAQSADLVIHFEAVQHWSARSLWDRNETLWGSWALIHPRFRFWFSGDLGYSQDIADIGKKYGGFDLAAIAIGSYEPRWFMAQYHLDPDEAVRAMLEVGARQALGIHWGTFQMSDEPLDQPPRDLDAALAARAIAPGRFFVLRHGETRKLSLPPSQVSH